MAVDDRLCIQIAALLEHEEKRCARRDYLNYVNEKGHRRAGAVNVACRARACRWMLRVACSVGLKRETSSWQLAMVHGWLPLCKLASRQES